MSKYSYVNIRMGTKNCKRFSNGNVLPLTAVPYGMASFTVQTEIRDKWWFFDPDSHSFEGIRLTHQPSPWMGDYGQLILCGQNGTPAFGEAARWSSYDPHACVLEPAYMRSYINRDRYTFELSPTNSGAIVRFDFLQESGNRILLIGEETTDFWMDEESGLLLGYTTAARHKPICGELREYFAISLDVPFAIERGENAVALRIEGTCACLRLAISFLSHKQAILHYERELSGKSLEEIRASATDEWERALSKIEIHDADEACEDRKRTFYSCLYRVFLWPRRFYELDENGNVLHLNMRTGEAAAGYYYADNGFWDTYRTVYPLLSLIDTARYAEMAEGFCNYYRDCGWLPKWLCPDNHPCMPGMLIEAVLADAIVKEIITGEVAETVLKGLLKDGSCEGEKKGEGREALGAYRKHGYVPYTVAKESVNETLDNCYGDYCIAQAAKKLGYDDVALQYMQYASNYKNLFDPVTGFMRGKDENGCFREEDFDCYAWGRDYTEGSAWQSSFAVPHDIKGLDTLYCGHLSEKIDALVSAPPIYSVGGYGFEIHEMSEMAAGDCGQCAISNQPSFHIPYIYSELGDVAKTAALVERLSHSFRATEDGYPGDEDNGSMSAWYVLSAMGLYQMCPSRPDFTTSLPLFDKMTVKLANGKTLVIEKDKLDPVQMKNVVSYSEILRGGALCDLVSK